MPRLRIACCQPGSARTILLVSSSSSPRIGGCPPWISFQETILRFPRSTTASQVRLAARSKTIANALRVGVADNSSLRGSSRTRSGNRLAGVILPPAFSSETVAPISSLLSGSSGCGCARQAPPPVAAMQRQAELPVSYGAQHELEISVAEKIQCLVPCAERVAFTSSGSEAVQLAQRLARAFTGRGLILKFEGHYHGWMDSALVSHHPAAGDLGPIEAPHSVPGSRGQVANAVLNVAVAPWNRLD